MTIEMGKEFSYKLSKQQGNRACYAEITIGIEAEQVQGGLSIDCADDIKGSWRAAVYFGIEYAWEHLQSQTAVVGGLRVNVVKVSGMPSDTTALCVAFVAMKALWEGMGVTSTPSPLFDSETWVFKLPP